jgi:hypothetical protein
VQGRDQGHLQISQQRQHVAARLPSEDAILVLQTDDINVIEVQEVSGGLVGVDVLLLDLEPDALRVMIALFDIGDGHGEALDPGIKRRERLADVRGERGDPALAGQVIADEGYFPDVLHDLISSMRHGAIAQASTSGQGDDFMKRH